MNIAAVRWTSLSDFPGKVAVVLWTPGCNLRCPFCYNGTIVNPSPGDHPSTITMEETLEGIRSRRTFVDGVVITGGEPTLQDDLETLLWEVKHLALETKLDSNGTHPGVLDRLLKKELVDYVALDVKAPRARYGAFTSPGTDPTPTVVALEASMAILRSGNINYEFRTTVAPGLGFEDVLAIGHWISGAQRYVLQPFVTPSESRLVDESWRNLTALSPEELRELATLLRPHVPTSVRA